MKRALLCALIVAFSTVEPDRAHAESWPTLDDYVGDCTLIVKCRTEDDGETIRYKVLETWKGKYSPDQFETRPPEGYLTTNYWHGNENPVNGREVVFFFTPANPDGPIPKLDAHSTCFEINAGKVVYASTSEGGLRQEYSIGDFKKAILAAVGKSKK